MAKKKMINDEPLTLEPIGEAIEKAAKRLRQIGKGDPRIKEKVEVLETAQQLLKIVCGKTYG